jgi:hypothetical protein
MTKHIALFAVVTLVLLLAPAVRADTYHSSPDPDAKGGIKGKVKQFEDLQYVIALEPYTIKAYQGAVDPLTGEFSFRGLPPGEYDLLIKTVGHIYEGFTLEQEPGQSATPAQLAALRDEIAPDYFKQERFFNNKWITRLTGKDGQARMVTIMARDLDTMDPDAKLINKLIRRISFVDLVKTRDVWQITTSRHILRQEVPFDSKDAKIDWKFSPDLSGILVGEKVRDAGEIDLDKLTGAPRDRYIEAKFSRTGLLEGK